MAASLEVDTMSRKLIKPSIPTPEHLRKLRLSLFDQLAVPWYFNVILYYSGPDDDEKKMNVAERRAELEKSLSEALPSLYLIAGRFIQDDFSIDCGDQGVEYVEAQVKGKLSEFLQLGPPIELLDKFLPWDNPPPPKSATSPLLAIQVNTFDCGGLVLGIKISHIIADGGSLGQFLNTWATTCRGIRTNGVTFSSNYEHCVAKLFPARNPEEAKSLPLLRVPKQTENADTIKIQTARFFFDQAIMAKIIESAASVKGASPDDLKSTKVVVALALIWKGFMALSASKHGHTRDSALSIAMSLRGRVSTLKIPENIFGNFCISVIVSFDAEKDTTELYDLIVLVRDAIRSTIGRVSQASDSEEASSVLIECRRSLYEKWDKEREGLMDVYLCSSWRGFPYPMYGADFGWGKPDWVSVGSQHSQGVWIMDGSNGDAIEVWVSLEEKDMEKFKQDPDISAFLSTQL
ncbi:OLC1v1025589C1 [Oldenlandia corymbosa var. corymbosa]|uniref:OLC1v1025589C1 n=1 Tax=Oldenlandia corymbosa var. corymbosa TaxID=529605 RepID=A0AAV1C5T4_OLDCO|nr:OLC1v1025589C1 [Oldenlandia corymbosa var. corymbosa]